MSTLFVIVPLVALLVVALVQLSYARRQLHVLTLALAKAQRRRVNDVASMTQDVRRLSAGI